jgi:hypothetical protein
VCSNKRLTIEKTRTTFELKSNSIKQYTLTKLTISAVHPDSSQVVQRKPKQKATIYLLSVPRVLGRPILLIAFSSNWKPMTRPGRQTDQIIARLTFDLKTACKQ